MGIDGLEHLHEHGEFLQEEATHNNYFDGAKRDQDIEEIRQLEESGVLGREQCPEPGYWHWPVLKLEQLPSRFHAMFIEYGEIRW